MPLTEVDDNADTKLAQQISQISGVGQVSIGGEQKPAIRIQLDPAKLVAKNISLEDVRAQLAITTVNTPKGSIDGEVRSYTIYANDQLTAADAWNDVIIAYRNGAPLRVRDIGRAVSGPEDAKKAAWASRQARRVPRRLQAAGRQRHRDRRSHQGRAAAPAGGHAAVAARRYPERPHADHSRLGRGRASSPCC